MKERQKYDRKTANRRRLQHLLMLKKQNNMVHYDCEKYLYNKRMTEQTRYIASLYNHVGKCGNAVLLKNTPDGLEYVTARRCKDRLCAICNHERKVALRRKYVQWFNGNPVIYETPEGKFLTKEQGGAVLGWECEYNLMAITLTVPHSNGEYKGQRIYYRQLIEDFNLLRKRGWWKSNVFGGEFGVEATLFHEKRGLHIHIHALLLVRKFEGNRNWLHRNILIGWNKITSGSGCYNEMTAARRAAIKKGNSTITDADIDTLTTSGATLVEVENIYLKKKINGQWCKVYPVQDFRNDQYKESLIMSILETISYHFKPKMFDVGDGHYNIPLIAKIYSATKGRQLYAKFGIFQKEKSLNLDSMSVSEELEEANNAAEGLSDVEGGHETNRTSIGYAITNPYNLYISEKNGNIMIRDNARVSELPTASTVQALKVLMTCKR